MASNDPATKADLERFATRDELKAELARFATRDELKAELARFTTKDELHAVVDTAKEELRSEIKQTVTVAQKQLSWEIAHSANAICETVIDQVPAHRDED